MKRKQVSVTVTKTVQVVQYEPVTISVTEVADCTDDEAVEAKVELYESASKSVRKFMKEEKEKWAKRSKD